MRCPDSSTVTLQKIFGLLPLIISIIFLAMPQVNCSLGGGVVYTGFALIQQSSGEYAVEPSGLVVATIFMLAIACSFAGVIGLVSFLFPAAALSMFRVSALVGVAACVLAMIARGDNSLRGADIHFEIGFCLVFIGFLVLYCAPWLERSMTREDSR